VTWSLRYEWMFYASLIVMAFFARNRLSGLFLPLVSLTIAALLVFRGRDPLEAVFALLFSVGMIAS
jgi:hypothetical protein